jgi:hypothetical protein
MDFLTQLDDLFRETINETDLAIKKRKYDEFCNRLEAQVARLPQEQQAEAFQPVMKQMALYASLQQNDPEDLKVRLGLRGPSAAINRLAQVAEGAPRIDVMPQVDEFWRETLGRDRKFIEKKYHALFKNLQDQVSHLPKVEQDALLWQVIAKNKEYTDLALRDRPALKAKLGLPVSSASSVSTNRLAQVAAETVVRATIWESIRRLFRAFR